METKRILKKGIEPIPCFIGRTYVDHEAQPKVSKMNFDAKS